MESNKNNSFAKLGEYKNDILTNLLSDKNLIKALKYPIPDFLEQKDMEDPTELLYSQIYPLPYIPDFQQMQGTFLTLDMNGFNNIDREFKNGYLFINIFANVDVWTTNYGINRIDYIGSKVYEILNESRDLGVGKLEWIGWDSYRPEIHVLGITITFKLVDFQ